MTRGGSGMTGTETSPDVGPLLRLLMEVADAAREVPIMEQPERLRSALGSLALFEVRAVEAVIAELPDA